MQNRGSKGLISVMAAFATCAMTMSVASAAEGWSVKSENGRCWAISQPKSLSQGKIQRGVTYAAVQNSPADSIRGSFSAISGTAETAKGDVTIEVDGKSFEVLPFGEAAFVKSGAPEIALLAAMKNGTNLKVTWKLQSGEVMIDTYALNGFAAAKKKIDKDCH